MVLGLAKKIRACLRSWLTADRVRSSASERAWLEISPPCVIFWQGEEVEVLNRREQTMAQGSIVFFECLTHRGRETMLVSPGDLHQGPKHKWSRV